MHRAGLIPSAFALTWSAVPCELRWPSCEYAMNFFDDHPLLMLSQSANDLCLSLLINAARPRNPAAARTPGADSGRPQARRWRVRPALAGHPGIAMQAWKGDPRKTQVFRFGSCSYDAGSGEATLSYFLDDGPELIERLGFPHAPWPPDSSRQAAFLRALDLLHWIAGVSYYKAALPAQIQFDRTDSRTTRGRIPARVVRAGTG